MLFNYLTLFYLYIFELHIHSTRFGLANLVSRSASLDGSVDNGSAALSAQQGEDGNA